jgi:hypothetical protein
MQKMMEATVIPVETMGVETPVVAVIVEDPAVAAPEEDPEEVLAEAAAQEMVRAGEKDRETVRAQQAEATQQGFPACPLPERGVMVPLKLT